MKIIKNKLVFFIVPIFFAISFVLVLFWQNIGQLSSNLLLLPLLVVIGFALLITAISYFFFKNRIKSELFSSIFILLFFSYRGAATLLAKIQLPIRADYTIFIVWSLIMIFSFFIIKRTEKNLFPLHKFLLLTALFAILLPSSVIAHYQISQRSYPEPIKSPSSLPLPGKIIDKKNLPDIYYLLPDSYSSSATLEEYLDYDNSSFLEFLESKGFYLAQQSTSNYPKTFLSLASTLNMEYLDYLSKFKNSSDETITTPLIQNSNLMNFLKNLGYDFYQLGSWWEPTHYNPLADENFILENKGSKYIGEFNYAILKSTMINPLSAKLFPKIGQSTEEKRERILYQFEKLPEVAELNGPKFVFTHIIAPHAPYVFDADCQFLSFKETEGKTEEENYLNQLSCINQKLEEVIDSILENSSRPAVILLQSDEGIPFVRDKLSPTESWEKATSDLLKEKFPILAAYYLPGVSKSALYPSITPVNSFRVILNLYFSTDLPLLPDKNYIFPNTNNFYEFKDITAELTD